LLSYQGYLIILQPAATFDTKDVAVQKKVGRCRGKKSISCGECYRQKSAAYVSAAIEV